MVEITTDYEFLGNNQKFACNYKALPTSVKVGQKILAADGALTMKVVELRENSIIAQLKNSGILGERKNMNLPGVIVEVSFQGTEHSQEFFANHNIFSSYLL